MNRRSIPEYDMHETGAEHLRRQGILVMSFMDSVHLVKSAIRRKVFETNT